MRAVMQRCDQSSMDIHWTIYYFLPLQHTSKHNIANQFHLGYNYRAFVLIGGFICITLKTFEHYTHLRLAKQWFVASVQRRGQNAVI